ncbi:MFS transporter [Nocardiopsis coralliicola]
MEPSAQPPHSAPPPAFAPAPPRAGRRAWTGLAVLTLPALLVSMDLTVLFMAGPLISADLRPTGEQLLWIMDVYGFLLAGCLLTMGPLGDRIGRRRLLLIGAAAFGAASLSAALAPSAPALIAARALLGIGGATLAPSSLSLIRTLFADSRQRRTAVGVWTSAFAGGVPLGWIIGGLLVEHFPWGSVFLINIPVMLLLLAAAPLLLPEYRVPSPDRFDAASAGLSLAAVLPLVWGIKRAAAGGPSPEAAAALAVGLLLGAAFIRRQLRSTAPLIDPALFRNRRFSAALGASTVFTLASAGTGLLVVQFLLLVAGLRPFASALWMLPSFLVLVAGVAVANVLAARLGPGPVIAVGAAAMGGGLLLVAGLGPDDGPGSVLAAYSLVNAGMGMGISLCSDTVLATAPAEKAGAAASSNEALTEFGGAVGIAVLGSISAAAYTAAVGPALPAGLSSGAAEAARGTLGGAAAVAADLPASQAGPLLRTAEAAFTDGLTAAAGTGAALLFAAAAAAAVLLRSRAGAAP